MCKVRMNTAASDITLVLTSKYTILYYLITSVVIIMLSYIFISAITTYDFPTWWTLRRGELPDVVDSPDVVNSPTWWTLRRGELPDVVDSPTW